jgi:hypothetical protein
MFPIGKGNMKNILNVLIADTKLEEIPFCMFGLCLDMVTELEGIMPDKFTFIANRDNADYIYLREDLATLKGKKYQPKRNHINKFKEKYLYEYVPITSDNVRDCWQVEIEWKKAKGLTTHNKEADDEHQAILYALKHFDKLGLMGGALYINGTIVAFTYGMPINHEIFGVNVEKADNHIVGAYSTINYEFANRIPETYIYINREEDLGIEGLRKAKLSYYPVNVFDKYTAYLMEESMPHDSKRTSKNLMEALL